MMHGIYRGSLYIESLFYLLQRLSSHSTNYGLKVARYLNSFLQRVTITRYLVPPVLEVQHFSASRLVDSWSDRAINSWAVVK